MPKSKSFSTSIIVGLLIMLLALLVLLVFLPYPRNIFAITIICFILAPVMILKGKKHLFPILRSKKSNDERLNDLLGNLGFITWKYNHEQQTFIIKGNIEELSGHHASEFHTNPKLFRKIIHPYDLFGVKLGEKEVFLGKKKSIEYRILKPNGEVKWVNNFIYAKRDNRQEVIALEGIMIDITHQKEEHEKMNRMAFFDKLTELPNRAMFENYFANFVTRTHYVNQKMGVLFIDLNGFKGVNDSYGHLVGDLLLKEVAFRLKIAVRGTDMISRLGGDEFVALLTRIADEDMITVATRVMACFDEAFEIYNHEIRIGASIGISIYPDDGLDLETLIKKADQAMYTVKSKGKSDYSFFEPSQVWGY